jgi:hypothetical protein
MVMIRSRSPSRRPIRSAAIMVVPKPENAAVIPNIRTRTTVAPEFDVVQMRSLAGTEDNDEFVLAAIE